MQDSFSFRVCKQSNNNNNNNKKAKETKGIWSCKEQEIEDRSFPLNLFYLKKKKKANHSTMNTCYLLIY